MTLLEMDFESIYNNPWRATKFSFTSFVASNRKEFIIFSRKIMNTEPTFLLPIGGSSLTPLINWKKGWSGLNIPRSTYVGGSSLMFFSRIINQPFIWIILYVFRTCPCLMHIHGINNNHHKYGFIHPLPLVICSDLPLNKKIVLALLIVPIDEIRCTVVGLYNHRHLEDSLHQLWLHIITLFRHLKPSNMIEGPLCSGRFIIPNQKNMILVKPHYCNSTNTIIILINAYQFLWYPRSLRTL